MTISWRLSVATLLEQQECAMETISACRLEASVLRQTGMFPELAKFLTNNANEAERWLARSSRRLAAALRMAG
jgi:hypothetical protein